jgi:hypothetical protein
MKSAPGIATEMKLTGAGHWGASVGKQMEMEK